MNTFSFPTIETLECTVDSNQTDDKTQDHHRVCTTTHVSQQRNQTASSLCSSKSENNSLSIGCYEISQHTTGEVSSFAVESVHSVDEETQRESSRRRKPYVMKKPREVWTSEEHQRFVQAIQLYHRDWKQIEKHVGTKNVLQIRSHAQKYFSKVQKYQTGEYVPPPRPKRKYSHHSRQRQQEETSPLDRSMLLSNDEVDNSAVLPQGPGPPNKCSDSNLDSHWRWSQQDNASNAKSSTSSGRHPSTLSSVNGYSVFNPTMNDMPQVLSYTKQNNGMSLSPAVVWMHTTCGWCLVPVYPYVNHIQNRNNHDDGVWNHNIPNTTIFPYHPSIMPTSPSSLLLGGVANGYNQLHSTGLESNRKPMSSSSLQPNHDCNTKFHGKVNEEISCYPNVEEKFHSNNIAPETHSCNEPCSDVEVRHPCCPGSQSSSDPCSNSSSPHSCQNKYCKVNPMSQGGTQMSHLISVALQDWVEWNQE
ncbi:hypothetical protein GpartN1_g3690.t1 [Galdieria partita]|uniref:Uncharacterized protein n=1 Tax=Galdieria partita TaxID=83374 RepID=A0A9C7PXB9_9RHOD|nr:hypothetical protein GpartN1_g3690.t1 [Galdieria partita]